MGQIIRDNCFLQTSLFLNEVWDHRISFKFWDNIIANIDEITHFFNMTPTKTISKKGGKSIIIRIQNQEKFRVSAF